jgi:hypothetical protein
MTHYEPTPPFAVESLDEMLTYLVRELREISRSMHEVDTIVLHHTHVEPEKLLDGMLVMADGASWDPGSGRGLYRYDADTSSWIFLG